MGELQATAEVDWAGYGGEINGSSGHLHACTAGQPELGGPGGGTNPEELFAAAHANCFTSTLTALARSSEIPLTRVLTTATARLHWTDGEGDHHLAIVDLGVQVESTAPWQAIERLVEATQHECPVCRAITGNVQMNVTLSKL
jgi:peroxiredoxin-like protein